MRSSSTCSGWRRFQDEPLLGVVGRPDVERGEGVDRAPVGDGPGAGDLGPSADPDAVGLRDAAVHRQRVGRRLTVGPDSLLERAAKLWLMRLAHQVAALVVERRVQEEALVVEREVLAGLADPALAQGHELLAFGERPHGHSPFFESDRHR